MKIFDKTNYARVFFGILISVIYAGVLIALITYPIPDSNRSAVDILIGSIGTMLGMVYAFYFGTSDGSVKKSDIIEKMKGSVPKNQTIISDSTIDTVLDEDPTEETCYDCTVEEDDPPYYERMVRPDKPTVKRTTTKLYKGNIDE